MFSYNLNTCINLVKQFKRQKIETKLTLIFGTYNHLFTIVETCNLVSGILGQ